MRKEEALYCDDADALAEAVQAAIERKGLLEGVRRLGVAVSGGADSVALLHLLRPVCVEKKIALVVLHLDHGLRSASAKDASFVTKIAEKQGLRVHVERCKVDAHLSGPLSLEMAARHARMAFFERCRRRLRLDAIATGHHADDVAETVLLRLVRGAGVTGLASIRPRSGHFIRPLLCASARAIRAWLKQQKVAWREDESNVDVTIPRNQMRHEMLPYIEKKVKTGIRAQLCRTAAILREEDDFLDQCARALLAIHSAGARLICCQLTCEHIALQRRVVLLWLWERIGIQHVDLRPTFDTVERVRLLEEGEQIQLSEKTRVAVRGGSWMFLDGEKRRPAAKSITVPGTTCWGDVRITCTEAQGIESLASGAGRYPAVCTINPEALGGQPLRVRARKPGDRMAPYGLKGSKKIQDIFVDDKVPEEARDGVPLIVCGDDVVWIPGYRIADRFALPSKNANCLRIEVK